MQLKNWSAIASVMMILFDKQNQENGTNNKVNVVFVSIKKLIQYVHRVIKLVCVNSVALKMLKQMMGVQFVEKKIDNVFDLFMA